MDRHTQGGVRVMSTWLYPLARAWAYFVVAMRNQKSITPMDIMDEAHDVTEWIVSGKRLHREDE